MKNMRGLPVAACAILAAAFASLAAPGARAADAPAAGEILSRMDANRAFSTIAYEATMTIRSGGKERVKSMVAWAEGKDKAFVEFTNREDLGVRFLKLGKDLWMWFPKERDKVKISGHLLKEGMMGSDVTYEEALESDALGSDYDASVLGSETVDGRATWKLELVSRSKGARWDRRVMWVDAERYVPLKEEVWSKGGVLQRVILSRDVKRFGTRWYPATVEMRNALKTDSSTVFRMLKATFDAPIDPSTFTMERLTR